MKQEIEGFLQYLVTQGKTPSTAKNYRLYLKRFTDFIGNIPLKDLTIGKIIDFQNYIAKNGYSPATANYHSVAIRSFLTYLHKTGYITISPTAIDLPKVTRQESDYLSEDEITKFINSASGRDRIILLILTSTGARVGEICNIRISDIKLKDREIVIRKGKGGKSRVVFLTDEATKYLTDYLLNNLDIKDRLFPITTRSVQRIIDKYTKKAGINKKCHPHMFRHSLASNLLRKGVDLRHVQQILGHSNITTTTLYTHTTNTELKEVFDEANHSIVKINKSIQPNTGFKQATKLFNMLSEILENQKTILEELRKPIVIQRKNSA